MENSRIMEKKRILIASAARASNLARALQENLNKEDTQVTIWIERTVAVISQTIIEMLEIAVADYDFIVLILTRDDLFFKELGNVNKLNDTFNCAFEAGLFMGALGQDRFFLISNIEPKALPVAFRSVTHFSFSQPDNLEDYNECSKAIKNISKIGDILKKVERKGKLPERLRLNLLSFEEVLERQKPMAIGGELVESLVVYLLNEPPEVDYKFATQVKNNMEAGVEYCFFLPPADTIAEKIWNLFQMIILAFFINKEKSVESLEDRLILLKKNKALVLEKIKYLADRDYLNIFFCPTGFSFPLLLHNASNAFEAKTYLMYGDRGFMKWAESKETVMTWMNLKSLYPADADLAKGIFHSTLFYDLYSDQGSGFRNKLDDQLRKYFPDIHNKVKRLCFSQ